MLHQQVGMPCWSRQTECGRSDCKGEERFPRWRRYRSAENSDHGRGDSLHFPQSLNPMIPICARRENNQSHHLTRFTATSHCLHLGSSTHQPLGGRPGPFPKRSRKAKESSTTRECISAMCQERNGISVVYTVLNTTRSNNVNMLQ